MSSRQCFWYLDPPDSTRGLYAPADWTEDVDLAQVRCPVTSSHDTAGARIGNLRVRLGYSRAPDLVWTWGSELMIQDHVLTRFREASLTGFEVRPVDEVRFARPPKEPREPPRLWEVVVMGWGGEVGPRSGLELVYHCEGCRRMEYTIRCQPGPLIDPDQWDGSDFFVVWPLSKYIFVTTRVADVIRAERYKGAKLVPADELRFGMRGEVVCGLSPGPPPPGRHIRGPEAYPNVKVRRWDGVPKRPAWVMRGEEPPPSPKRRRGGPKTV